MLEPLNSQARPLSNPSHSALAINIGRPFTQSASNPVPCENLAATHQLPFATLELSESWRRKDVGFRERFALDQQFSAEIANSMRSEEVQQKSFTVRCMPCACPAFPYQHPSALISGSIKHGTGMSWEPAGWQARVTSLLTSGGEPKSSGRDRSDTNW